MQPFNIEFLSSIDSQWALNNSDYNNNEKITMLLSEGLLPKHIGAKTVMLAFEKRKLFIAESTHGRQKEPLNLSPWTEVWTSFKC